MDSTLDYIAARLQEPSTYASLGMLFTAIGWQIAPDQWQAIAGICMGVGGLIGSVLRERKKATEKEIKEVAKEAVHETVTPEALK